MCLCFSFNFVEVRPPCDGSQVIVVGSAVSLSVSPCFLLQDQKVLTVNRLEAGYESCGEDILKNILYRIISATGNEVPSDNFAI